MQVILRVFAYRGDWRRVRIADSYLAGRRFESYCTHRQPLVTLSRLPPTDRPRSIPAEAAAGYRAAVPIESRFPNGAAIVRRISCSIAFWRGSA